MHINVVLVAERRVYLLVITAQTVDRKLIGRRRRTMGKLTIDEIIGHCERKTEQYERFYKREYLETMPLTSSAIKEYWEHRQVVEYLRKLKDYEDLEEQGKLIKLPCKVGDTVYVNGVLGCGEAERYRVIRVDTTGH